MILIIALGVGLIWGAKAAGIVILSWMVLALIIAIME